MADPFVQDFIDGRTDVKAFAQWWYADASVSVARRLAPPVKSFNYYIQKLEEEVNKIAAGGGRVGYVTYAEMEAAAALPAGDPLKLPAQSVIEIGNDTEAINGVYTYDGTTFTKTLTAATANASAAFHTVALMEASTLPDGRYAKVLSGGTDEQMGWYQKRDGVWSQISYSNYQYAELSITEYPVVQRWWSLNLSKWVSSSAYLGKIIPVNTLSKYVFETGENKLSIVLRKDGTLPVVNSIGPVVEYTFAANTTNTLVIPEGITHIWMSNSVVEGYGPAKRISQVAKILSAANVTSDYDNYDDNSVPSIASVRELSQNVKESSNYLEPFTSKENLFEELPLSFTVGSTYGIRSYLSTSGDNPETLGVELSLLAGDLLEFDYTPIIGTVLWHKVSSTSGWSLLTPLEKDPSKVIKHSFAAYTTMTVRISSSVYGSIKINGVAVADTKITNLGAFSAVQLRQITATGDPVYANYKRSGSLTVKKGDTIKITNVGSAHYPILVESFITPEIFFGVLSVASENPATELVWTADADATIRVAGTTDSKFYLKKPVTIETSIDGILKDYASTGSLDKPLPEVSMPALEKVFATHQNYLLKTVTADGINYIDISQDLGKTWTRIVNVIGDVVSYHFYSDGTIQLCSPTKVWWTSDYLTFNESTVYDIDGSIFVPTTHHFFCQQNGDSLTFVGDQEMHIWGEYVIGSKTTRIWYSLDKGRTIKCAVKFGTTVMDGSIRNVRHVHAIYYREKTQTFYLATGDHGVNGSECLFMSAKYDVTLDKFTWTLLGQGENFKFGNMFFDDHYAYIITDYTVPELQKNMGIFRVAVGDLGDISKYRLIYKTDPAEWGDVAPFRLIIDNNGNKVLLVDWVGQGVIWVAKQGLDFKKVAIMPKVLLSYIIGPNYNGDVYCVPNNVPNDMLNNANLKLTGGTYNLTKALREAGLTNFMVGEDIRQIGPTYY